MSSKIPAAIDGLLALCNALSGSSLTGVDIIDGPLLKSSENGRRLYIGYEVDGIAAHGQQEWASMPKTGNARAERVTIRCVAESSTGDTVMKTRRDDAFAIVAAVEGAIKNDPTLSGAVTYSNMAEDIEVRQPQTQAGAVCTVFFGVHYYARFS